MAGRLGTICTGSEIGSTTSPKKILELRAHASVHVRLREASIAFKGVTATDAPVLVELLRDDADGAGGNVVTPAKLDARDSSSILATAKSEAAAGSNSVVLKQWEIHPQAGALVYAYPLDMILAGGKAAALRVTAGTGVNCVASMEFEE